MEIIIFFIRLFQNDVRWRCVARLTASISDRGLFIKISKQLLEHAIFLGDLRIRVQTQVLTYAYLR